MHDPNRNNNLTDRRAQFPSSDVLPHELFSKSSRGPLPPPHICNNVPSNRPKETRKGFHFSNSAY